MHVGVACEPEGSNPSCCESIPPFFNMADADDKVAATTASPPPAADDKAASTASPPPAADDKAASTTSPPPVVGEEIGKANAQDDTLQDPAMAAAKQWGLQPPEILRAMSGEERMALEKKLRRKIDLRILPMIIVMYILNYIDR